MICFKDALKRIVNPNAPLCANCLADSQLLPRDRMYMIRQSILQAWIHGELGDGPDPGVKEPERCHRGRIWPKGTRPSGLDVR